jgi:hypothetical protein
VLDYEHAATELDLDIGEELIDAGALAPFEARRR